MEKEIVAKYKMLKRLHKIRELQFALDNNQDINKFDRLTKVAYTLWKKPKTRESDITLSLEYYKLFYPDYVVDEKINFKDFYIIPKMYDIQRDRATVQNDERLFRPSVETLNKRFKKQIENEERYSSYIYTPEYSLFLDDSGKTDNYFFIAGILVNGNDTINIFSKEIIEIKNKIAQKHNIVIKELKFNSIDKKNYKFYIEFLEQVQNLFDKVVFCSSALEVKHLKEHNKKRKPIDCIKLMLEPITFLAVRYSLKSTLTNSLSNLNIIIDENEAIDVIGKNTIEQELQEKINHNFEYFARMNKFTTQDSKENILIQLADLYAGSLNNVFSAKEIISENAQCKRNFANKFLDIVGISKIDSEHQTDKQRIEYINKFIN